MEFIVTTPDDFDDAPTGPSTSSPPSPPKSKQWMPIVRNLLTKKLPQTEQDWDRMLRTQADVNRMLHRLVLSHLSPAERAALSWQALFTECEKHLELLSRDEREVGLCELFRLAIIGLAVIAMEDLRSDKTYQFLRQCLRPYCQSGQHLGDESLRKTLKAHIVERKYTLYRPKKQLQSGCLSVINLVYLLLGGELSGRSRRTIRDIFLPDKTLFDQAWPGSSFPKVSTQDYSQIAFSPSRGAPETFLILGHVAVGLKQTAISVTLTDAIISRPAQEATGLYSFGLPAASKKYFSVAVMEKAPEIQGWASKYGRTLDDILNSPAAAFRSEVGTATWPTLGGALVLPLTNEAVDIKLLNCSTGVARREVWNPNHMMCLEHEGLAAMNGSIHYIYVPINLA
ncbi:hypothetical protein Purlil1_13618 [Purpureocillium lilacinum]|uniref:Uncharacterized protein n=1 Tax=Purpureocillium lilacinum TaxID=33203 RepID=A0ABR0BDP0_PURLI|nr:hypothetical protein Purlil1_13618 [Purpureocillium lilacinum]